MKSIRFMKSMKSTKPMKSMKNPEIHEIWKIQDVCEIQLLLIFWFWLFGTPCSNVHPVLIRMISEKSHNLEGKKEGTNDVLIAPFALQKSFVSSCKWVPKLICSLNKELENWLFFVRFVLANENGRGFNQEFI